MNKLMIIGNLTRDPETTTVNTANGPVTVCRFTVAVNRRGQQDNADYFRVSAWRGLGTTCAKYLQKGRKVYVSGAASVSSYTGQDGSARASLELNADEVEFLSRVEARGEAYDSDYVPPAPADGGFAQVDPDDLPY